MWLPRWFRAPRRRPCATREASRRLPLTVEALEDRSLPSLTFQFTLNDPTGQFARFPLLLPDLQAVGQILSNDLQGQGTIQVIVRPNNSIPRSSGNTTGITFVRTAGGTSVYESDALAEAQTGRAPHGGPEIELDFNTQSYLPTAWFDPSGANRSGAVPSNQLDFISVALHEMTHGLGFNGYRALTGSQYGQLPSGYESAYDALTQFGAGGDPNVLYFVGPRAEQVYGGPVPLTSVGPSAFLSDENFNHVGNPQGPGAELAGVDLMNGVVFRYGTRYDLGTLDRAILADMGWSVNGVPAPAAAPPAPARGEVTGLVSFLLGPRRIDHRHHRILQTVVVVNTSGEPLLGPLTLVLLPPSGPSLRGAARGMVPAAQRLRLALLRPGEAAVFSLPLASAAVAGPGSSLHLLAGLG
jgi:hypothetical protein